MANTAARMGRGGRLAVTVVLGALMLGQVVGACGLAAFLGRDRVTPLDPDVAVERFRSEAAAAEATSTTAPPTTAAPTTAARARAGGARATTTTAAPVVDRPRTPHGVYTYDTTGSEELSLFGGSKHDYPAVTTITVAPRECGSVSRWQPFEGRYEERYACILPAGDELRHIQSMSTFFGTSSVTHYDCPPGSISRPHPTVPGQQWTFSCADAETSIAIACQSLATEPVTVEGTPVEAVRFSCEGTATGRNRGKSVQSLWVSKATNVLLREQSSTDVMVGSQFGDVRFREEHTLVLQRLEPRT